MDYKYIRQLLDRYWKCETTLEEEEILKAFFSQADVPDDMKQYKELFAYEAFGKNAESLGSDFDDKVLAAIGSEDVVKARKANGSRRFMPLFKAAAVVAIFVTLGNAAQMAFDESSQTRQTAQPQVKSNGENVAMGVDSASALSVDSMQQSSINHDASQGTMIK